MPIPTPNKNETQAEFISRCHIALAKEYPETDQRNAVCFKQWDDANRTNDKLERLAQEKFSDRDFHVFRDVPIFDEHVTKGRDGQVKTYDKAALEEIVRRCNRRIEDTGDFIASTIGHTPDANDPLREMKQPPLIGFYGPMRLGQIGNVEPRWCIFADEYVFKDEVQRATRHPRRSVEIWGDLVVDPIARLGASTPRRDLGLQFMRDGNATVTVEKYEMAAAPVAPAAPQMPSSQNVGVKKTDFKGKAPDKHNAIGSTVGGMAGQQLGQKAGTALGAAAGGAIAGPPGAVIGSALGGALGGQVGGSLGAQAGDSMTGGTPKEDTEKNSAQQPGATGMNLSDQDIKAIINALDALDWVQWAKQQAAGAAGGDGSSPSQPPGAATGSPGGMPGDMPGGAPGGMPEVPPPTGGDQPPGGAPGEPPPPSPEPPGSPGAGDSLPEKNAAGTAVGNLCGGTPSVEKLSRERDVAQAKATRYEKENATLNARLIEMSTVLQNARDEAEDSYRYHKLTQASETRRVDVESEFKDCCVKSMPEREKFERHLVRIMDSYQTIPVGVGFLPVEQGTQPYQFAREQDADKYARETAEKARDQVLSMRQKGQKADYDTVLAEIRKQSPPPRA